MTPRNVSTSRRRGRAAALLTVPLSAMLVAGCSGSQSAGGSSATSKSGGASAGGSSIASRQDAAGSTGSGGSASSGQTPASVSGPASTGLLGQARVLPTDRDLILTAELTVRVRNVAAAVAAAQDMALARGGLVASERSTADPVSPAHSMSTVTLRVPPAAFRTVLTRLAALGTRLSQTQSTQDVTSQLVDVGSRTATARRGVAQVRALLARADTLGKVLDVERELSRREADLESLEAQQKSLASAVSFSTVTATFQGTAKAVHHKARTRQHTGFATGLRSGWHALAATVLVVLTGVGAVVPFLPALALLGALGWWLRRRTVRQRTAPAPASTT